MGVVVGSDAKWWWGEKKKKKERRNDSQSGKENVPEVAIRTTKIRPPSPQQ